MRKVMVTIVGHDRPGIIYQVSRALSDFRCNVIEVSQTTLLGEFSGLFSCAIPDGLEAAGLSEALHEALAGSSLAHWVADVNNNGHLPVPAGDSEPYVVTVRGRDQLGIIPEFSGCMAGFDVNIENLRAVALSENQASLDPAMGSHQVVMFFELSVPRGVNQGAFRQALTLIAEDLEMEISLQHRDVFEAIHRL